MAEVERIQQQPCFVLHRYPYKNTSSIIDVLSRDHGRLNLVAKAVKQQKSPLKSVLQSFQPLMLGWVRRSELGTLTSAEFADMPLNFAQLKLYAALYINELLMRLLVQHDPVPEIFHSYQNTLHILSTNAAIEPALRIFEKELLQSLGYEIRLFEEADSHKPIIADKVYQYTPEHGFSAKENETNNQFSFRGEVLLAFHENRLQDKAVLTAAHRITYVSLKRLLGDKPLKSRELLLAYSAIG